MVAEEGIALLPKRMMSLPHHWRRKQPRDSPVVHDDGIHGLPLTMVEQKLGGPEELGPGTGAAGSPADGFCSRAETRARQP